MGYYDLNTLLWVVLVLTFTAITRVRDQGDYANKMDPPTLRTRNIGSYVRHLLVAVATSDACPIISS
jgi:hypothetical protein